MDKVDAKVRTKIMGRVKSRNTNLELYFRKRLWYLGLRYRVNCMKMFGKPDIYISKYKLIIFIDSCFWHGCSIHLRMPNTNKEYWNQKINRNINRDIEVNKYWKKEGCKTVRIWEHEINNNIDKALKKVIKYTNLNQ